MSKAVDRAAEQVYRGIWHGLVKWFKVPDEPPTLPTSPGEQLERFKPAEGFLRYLLLFFWIGLVIIDLIFLGIWLVSFAISLWLGLALLPVFLAVAILPDIVVYVAIHLRYDTTWYVLSDRSVRIRRGIWTITETTITFENVQDVKIALVSDRWEHKVAQSSSKGRITPTARKFLDALVNVLAGGGVTTFQGWTASTTSMWQAECVVLGLIDPSAKPDSARALFSKNRRDLVAAKYVACNGDLTWLL